jgi:redox-sensing transcriptional repressor
MEKKRIPESAISRLCVYLRELKKLSEHSIRTVSSAELGERTNLGDAQIRKDLGYFGQFGVSGAGYSVEELISTLEKILGKDKTWRVAIAGAGHLGSALLAYSWFREHGLNIVAAFDNDTEKIGRQVEGVTVRPVEDIRQVVKAEKIALSIIAVPAAEAQRVTDSLAGAGVKCILNFAPTNLNVPEGVKVKNIDLSRELETLSYFLVNGNDTK